jgi:uncharacterized protein (DUF58 family)
VSTAAYTTPERTTDQRRAALDHANEIRTSRATLKQQLKDREQAAVPLIEQPPRYAESMKVWTFLTALPRLGPVKINRLLADCRVSPNKTLGGLSARQRTDLAGALKARGVK